MTKYHGMFRKDLFSLATLNLAMLVTLTIHAINLAQNHTNIRWLPYILVIQLGSHQHPSKKLKITSNESSYQHLNTA